MTVSAENLRLVRRWYAAMSGGPEEAIQAVAELWDAGAEHHPVGKYPDGPSRSRQEFVWWLGRYFQGFPRNSWAINERIAVGDDRVLVCATLEVEGREVG